jgi:hypothetical protein
LFQVQKLRRDSVPRGKRDPERSARKRKIKGVKPLILRKFFQVRRTKKLRRRSYSNRQIDCREKTGPSDRSSDRRNAHRERTDLSG